MDKTTLLAFLLLLTNNAYSQQYVNSTKSSAKKSFIKYADKKNFKTITKETDSTLAFLVRDPTVQTLDILLHFDTQGKCDRELTSLSCDSCYYKILSCTLSNKYYRWTKVDGNTYYARFPYRLVLTTKPDTPFSFLIQRSTLAGYEYRRIIKNVLSK